MSVEETPEPVTFYAPRPVRDQVSPQALQLVRRALQPGGLAFYVGAGLSASPPTSLPSGAEVQRRLGGRAANLLGITVEPAGDEPTLEEIGAAAADRGDAILRQLRELALDTADFRNAPPNFGHRALALLLREGLVEVLSVNWDRAIEQAGMEFGFEVRPSLTQVDREGAGIGARMDKLNGCATRPATLRITREEIDEPLEWAEHRVGAVLTDATVVFVGLARILHQDERPDLSRGAVSSG